MVFKINFFISLILHICLFTGLFCSQSYAEKYPERIISLGPAITERIYLLSCEDKLVANTSYCQRPPAAVKKEKVGSLIDADIEKIISLKPDLVLAVSLTPPRLIRKMKNLGLRFEVFKQPKDFNELLKDFLRLGRLLDKEKESRAIIGMVRKKITEVKKTADELVKPKVFFQIGAKPLFTATGESFVNDFLEYSGGINIAKDARSGLYSREKVIKENPDIILIITMGIAGEDEKDIWGSYKTLNAAKNNRIYIMDSYKICSPSPVGLIDSLDEVFKLLHPEKNE